MKQQVFEQQITVKVELAKCPSCGESVLMEGGFTYCEQCDTQIGVEGNSLYDQAVYWNKIVKDVHLDLNTIEFIRKTLDARESTNSISAVRDGCFDRAEFFLNKIEAMVRACKM